MKQLLKDTCAFGAVSALVAAAYSWSIGSSAISHELLDMAEEIGERFGNLSTIEICALVYIIWVAASLYAGLVGIFSDKPRHIPTSTLMYGSFGTTVLAMSIIIWAGVRV